MSGSWSFGRQTPAFQRLNLDRAALDAEWDVPPGRLGQIIRQLRRRGMIAANRAKTLFNMLLVIIILGLAFYLGLPFWQQFADSRTATLTRQIAGIDARLEELDIERSHLIAGDGEDVTGLIEDLKGLPMFIGTLDDRGVRILLVIGDTLLVTNSRGEILRSSDGGTSFQTVYQDPGGRVFQQPILIGDTLLVTSSRGEILRSSDGGTSFQTVYQDPDQRWLNSPIRIDDAIFVTSNGGRILRSTDGGTSFQTVYQDPGGRGFHPLILLSNTLLVANGRGQILRSSDGGTSFQTIYDDPDQRWLDPPVLIGDTLLVSNDKGQILRSTDRGTSFQTVYDDPDQRTLNSPVVIGDAIFVTNIGGRLLRSTDGGTSFQTAHEDPDQRTLNSPVMIGDAVFVTSDGGRLLRSADGGTSFQTLYDDPVRPRLNPPVLIRDTLLVTSSEGQILRSTDGGASFHRIYDDFDRQAFNPPVLIGDTLLVISLDGQILRLAEDWSEQAKQVLNIPDWTDLDLQQFLNEKLAEGIRDLALLDAYKTALQRIQTTRAGLGEVRAETKDRRDEFKRMPYALLQQENIRLDYEAYLTICRDGATEETLPSLTETCDAGWHTQQFEEGNWWQTLAKQVPPAVLLLFLLATLGGLYRYNMRMAGFHHSRADLLELYDADPKLFARNQGETEIPFAVLADVMAADKVEFGRGNKPSDQVIDIVRSVMSRTNA